MTRFQTILAQLCASSGCTMLHLDTPSGLLDKLDANGHATLVEAIGAENLSILAQDQEVQLIVPGSAGEAEASGHIRMMRAIKVMVSIEGASVMLVTGSGKVSAWATGQAPELERLEDGLLTEAMARRADNATAPA